MKRISKRARTAILHALIIVAAIAIIKLTEYLFHLYLTHWGTELAAGGVLSRIAFAISENAETVAEVSESLVEVSK
jgi:hypothetical protein